MREKIEYYFVLLLIQISKILTIKATYRLFKYLSILAFHLLKKRKELTISNIQKALKVDNKTSKQLAINSYIHISKVLSYSILIIAEKISKDDILNSLINIEELEKLKNIISNSKNGAILITGHFGNWEMVNHILSISNIQLNVIMREGNNDLIDKNIVIPFRQKFGTKTNYKQNAALFIAKALKRGEFVGLLIDQKVYGKNTIICNFFDIQASTTTMVSELFLKFNSAVVLVFAIYEDEKVKIVVKEFENVIDENLSLEEKIFQITQKINDLLEDEIKKYPTQWFWMHNRWKI